MKLVTLALSFGLVASTADAAQYFVGENIAPRNHVSLGFQDTPTKKDSALTGADSGNIAAFEISGDYSPVENLSVGTELPFYFASEDVAGNSRSSLGNISLNGTWNQALSETTDNVEWGYSAALEVFLPTSRKVEGSTVAFANPTTDLYTYLNKGTTVTPRLGLYVENERFYGKTNFGFGYTNLPSSVAGGDKSRTSFTWQTALTWKATPYLNANLEYNAIVLDSATAVPANQDDKYRHAIAPSVSGEMNNFIASAFLSVPLDTPTRDIQAVAFGINAGYAGF